MRIITFINHYFLPGYSNNQRAKLLHVSSISLMAFILIIYQMFLTSIPVSGIKILGYASQISPSEVVRLTNEKRIANGLGSLEMNAVLSAAAQAKGADMLAKGYWAHVAPDGTEPWKFFLDSGYTYRYAGENLARDFSNPNSAVEAWMASPSHKENLLSPKYNDIGIAVVEGDLNGVDTTIIVQLFGTKAGEAIAQVSSPIEEVVEIAVTNEALDEVNLANPVPNVLPTPIPVQEIALVTPVPSGFEGQSLVAGLPDTIEEEQSVPTRVLVSPFNTTKGVSISIVALLLFVLVMDGLLVSRRRISRIGGRTFAHLAYLGMILAVAIILQSGEII